jgi:hypothetical protein
MTGLLSRIDLVLFLCSIQLDRFCNATARTWLIILVCVVGISQQMVRQFGGHEKSTGEVFGSFRIRDICSFSNSYRETTGSLTQKKKSFNHSYPKRSSMAMPIHSTFFLVCAQIEKFVHTTLLISGHGAAMPNCIFLPDHAVVVEVFPFHIYMDAYQRMSTYSGLLYMPLFSNMPSATMTWIYLQAGPNEQALQ